MTQALDLRKFRKKVLPIFPRNVHISVMPALSALQKCIESATPLPFPFPAILLQEFIDAKSYADLLKNFPNEGLFKEMFHPDAILPGGRSARQVFEWNEEGFRKVERPTQEVWLPFVAALHCASFQKSLFERLEVMADRGYARIALVRDAAGFKIRVHPDAKDKLLTLQLYLPSQPFQQGLGTTFYGDGHSPLATLPYRPNTGYAFKVCENSFHGRETLPFLKEPRMTLSVTYYREPGQGEFQYV